MGSVRAFVKEETCYIRRLVVHPDFQNQGTGTRLMDEIPPTCLYGNKHSFIYLEKKFYYHQRIKRNQRFREFVYRFYLRDAIRHCKNRKHLNFGSSIKTENHFISYTKRIIAVSH